MINFNLFVDETVSKWRSDKKLILENMGLGIPSNRKTGDSAEDYILRKVKGLPQNYIGKKSVGSQSPSDIFAVGRRDRYWHIMLIQVKSSKDANSIYQLTKEDQAILNEFGRYFKKRIGVSDLLKRYKNSSILVSTGYAGVFNDLKNKKHFLKSTRSFRMFNTKMSNLDASKIKSNTITAHKL